MARDSTSRGSVIAQTPVLAPYCGNYRCQHGDCCDRQSYFSDGLVSSPLQPLPGFVAPERPATAGYIGRESLDETEPLQQLSKLDVVAGNGAEQQNQLEPAHSHRSSSYFVPRSRNSPPRHRASFFRSAFCVPSGMERVSASTSFGDG
jgi:hypothetical protein